MPLKKVPMPKQPEPKKPLTPVDYHNNNVLSVIEQRKVIYSPAEGRRLIQFQMCDAVWDAVLPYVEGLVIANPGSGYCIQQMIGKLTRAIEGGLNGSYSGDNGLDLSGYEACLAAVARDSTPEGVINGS